MNYISRYVRLFPVNFQIDQEKINSILKKINSVSFYYYFWHYDYNCLDLLYTSKKPVDFFLNDRVLEKYQYWEIKSHEDLSTDTISCRSKFYKSKEDSTFNYASVCYYQTDQIKFIGFNKDSIYKLIECLKITITSVTSDHYICNKKLFYQASNDLWNSIDNLKAN